MNRTALPARPPAWRRSATLFTLALGLAGAAQAADKAEGFSIGLNVQPRATATDIGLPAYPGAVPDKEGEDQEGATVQLWGGVFGMQLHALALKTGDAPEAVARFYREALSRQGRLVDCSPGAAPEPAATAASQPRLLRCDQDRAKTGGHLFKLGLPGGVRMVSIEPAGRGSRIQLVRLMIRNE